MDVKSLILISAAACAFSASAAFAQLQSQSPRLHAVEQTVEDVSPLSVSLRSLQAGLGQPTGFEQVFRLPADREGRVQFMRMHGAIAAVFPRSVYADIVVKDRKVGELPLVPAGTVFKIGGVPEPARASGEARSRPPLAVSPEPAVQRVSSEAAGAYTTRQAASARVPEASPAGASDEAIERASMVLGEEAQRERRVRALLQRAVSAERAR